jgi:8-oxo-dGTP pyrophosphatase MutT (NUDIX family)
MNQIELRKEISSGCCVFRKSEDGIEILLIQPRKNDRWGFPKGRFNNNESPEFCAIRETIEETGIVPTITDYVGCVDIKNKFRIKRVFCYNAILNDRFSFDRDQENHDVKWFSIKKLPFIVPYQYALIKKSVKKFLKLHGY